eukprot:360269-Chlamydomonas_euryale.AAC.8
MRDAEGLERRDIVSERGLARVACHGRVRRRVPLARLHTRRNSVPRRPEAYAATEKYGPLYDLGPDCSLGCRRAGLPDRPPRPVR